MCVTELSLARLHFAADSFKNKPNTIFAFITIRIKKGFKAAL
jgi:hypothetical protein